jgi:hypothetical protein
MDRFDAIHGFPRRLLGTVHCAPASMTAPVLVTPRPATDPGIDKFRQGRRLLQILGISHIDRPLRNTDLFGRLLESARVRLQLSILSVSVEHISAQSSLARRGTDGSTNFRCRLGARAIGALRPPNLQSH